MTRQEIFDTVATALLNQGKPAVTQCGDDLFACCYLTEDGDKCAVGHLFNDQEIELFGDFEGGIDTLLEGKVEDKIRPLFFQEEQFLTSIQSAHDLPATSWDELAKRTRVTPPEEWLPKFKKRMREVATYYDLNPASLNT